MSREQLRNQETQGGISDFDFTVTKSYFEEIDMSTPEKQVDPVLALHWEGTTNLESHPILGSVDFHPTFTLGKDWVTMDGGKTITNPNPKAKLGGWYGRLGTQIDEITKHLEGKPDDPVEGIDPKSADSWLGTQWHMDGKDYDFGKFGKTNKLMPTAYLGKGGSSVPPAPTTAGASSATATVTSNGGGDIRGTLTALAKSAANYSEFQAKALRVDGVTADSALLDEVLDESRFFTAARS